MARSYLRHVKPATTDRDEPPLRSSSTLSPSVLVCAFNKRIAVEFEEKLKAGLAARPWSPQQQKIFAWFEQATGNLVTVARAGTGKSTTILAALAHIPGRPHVEVKTLHALGFSYLRRAWPNAKVDLNEVEWDRIDAAQSACGVGDLSRENRRLVKKLVSRAKGTVDAEAMQSGSARACAAIRAVLASMEEAAALNEDDASDVVDLCAHVLAASLEPDPEGRISFDDMIFVPVLHGWVTARYDWVMVDECQDMSPIQLRLAQAACRPSGHLVFVGDDKQAIYGFRGADSDCLARLKTETQADELTLTTTYRCPKTIVARAALLVPDFTAADSAPDGEVLQLAYDTLAETAKPGDAILSRINAPLVGVCLDLLKRDTPAVISGRDIGEGLLAIVKKVRGTTIVEFVERLARWRRDAIERVVARDKGRKREGQDVSDAATKHIEEIEDRVACLDAIAETVDSMGALDLKLGALFSDEIRTKASRIVTCSSVHKCVAPSTWVETIEGGVQQIREIGTDGRIATANGFKAYRELVRYPKDAAIRIRTRCGYSVTVTPEHKMMAWTGESYEPVEAQELSTGQYLRLVLGPTVAGLDCVALPLGDAPSLRERSYNLPTYLSPDFAEFLGMLVADGTIYRAGFRYVKADRDVVDRFGAHATRFFGVDPHEVHLDCAAHGVEINSTFLSRWLLKFDGVAPNVKMVPSVILNAGPRHQRAFLRGLFEDGTVNVKKERLDHIAWSTCFGSMARLVQLLLLRHGIVSSRGLVCGQWFVWIYGPFAKKFIDEIGFVSSRKMAIGETPPGTGRYVAPVPRSLLYGDDVQWSSAIHNARHRGTMSRWELGRLAHCAIVEDTLRYHHDPITALEPVQAESMCVTVPSGGRFVQNGFDGCNSKGLEWPRVFILLDSFTFGKRKGPPSPEENNIRYVAITRAQATLVEVTGRRMR